MGHALLGVNHKSLSFLAIGFKFFWCGLFTHYLLFNLGANIGRLFVSSKF